MSRKLNNNINKYGRLIALSMVGMLCDIPVWGGASVIGSALMAEDHISNEESAANHGEGGALNYTLVNQNLDTAAHQISGALQNVQELSLSIDPQYTNPERDQYKVNTAVTLRHSGWSQLPSKASASLKVKVLNASNQNMDASYESNLSLTVATDSLAFLKFIAKKKVGYCAHSNVKEGLKGALLSSHCEGAKKLQNAQSLDEVKQIYQEQVNQLNQSLEQELKVYTAFRKLRRQNLSGTIFQQEANLARKKIVEITKALKAIKISDHSDGFTLKVADINLRAHEFLSLEKVSLQVKGSQAAVSISFNCSLGANFYKYKKPEIRRLLFGLQQNQPFAVEMVKMDLRIMAAMINDLVQ